MMSQLEIPESTGLVVGQYVDSYRFELGECVFTLDGEGVLHSDGEGGTITPMSAHHLSMIGNFDASISSDEDVSFCFDTVQFSGAMALKVDPGTTITFISCSFDSDSKIEFSGGPCGLRFIGCSFDRNFTVDCTDVILDEQPEIIDCFEEEGAGFLIGRVDEAASTWQAPLLALAVAGMVAGAAAAVASKKTKKKVERHEQQFVK